MDLTSRLDYFTDREEELAAVDRVWAGPQRVLCLSGVSGIGKSTLLEYLRERRLPVGAAVLVDLANPRLMVGYRFVSELAGKLQTLPGGLDWRRFEAAEDDVIAEGQRLRASRPSVDVHQEITVRGRAAGVGGSPQSVMFGADAFAAELAARVEQHERDSRGVLLRELCRTLARATRPFAVLVDTYEAVAHAADTEFRHWPRFVRGFRSLLTDFV